jgi:hypothetical protein
VFYLGNIYQVLADPNTTLSSVPTPVAKPPPFSRPGYAVWVNSLWFLSLVMSLSCALWATSLHQWARRYIRLTQLARCSPEKRARKRAFFANGVDTMHVPWAVEGLPTLLHLSLFLFFVGLAIFLFNVDREVFTCVLLWIVFFSIVYGLVTLLPFIRHDSPYNTPLTITARFLCRFLYNRIRFLYAIIRFLYARIRYLALKVLVHYLDWYRRNRRTRTQSERKYHRRRYWRWRTEMDRRLDRLKSVSVSVEKKAEESAEEQSSEIDIRILGWTISALGDDDSLEKFFEAIPGFFNSKLIKDLERDFPVSLLKTFWDALEGFMDRTSSFNSVTESVKSRRVITCGDIMSTIPRPDDLMNPTPKRDDPEIIPDPRRPCFDLYEAPVSIERLQAMARWFTHLSSGVSDCARNHVVRHLPRLKERDIRWVTLASDACGLDMHGRYSIWFVAQDMGGDNMLLNTLIGISQNAIHLPSPGMFHSELMEAFTQFDIRHTLPELQHDFCTLWNEAVQEARNRGMYSAPIWILRGIRSLYITLHQGTEAAPTAFSASTDNRDWIMYEPSSYPLCNIASHRPDSTACVPDPNPRSVSPPTQLANPSTSGISRHVKETIIIPEPHSPSHPTTPSEIRDNSLVPATASPTSSIDAGPRLTDASPSSELQDNPLADMLPCPLEGTILQDMVAQCAEPDTSQILSTASTVVPASTPAPAQESTPRIPNKSSIPCDADAASASYLLPPASSVVGFSIPASSPPSRPPPLPNAELLALLDGTTPSGPTCNAALPHLRARGLVNNGSMCFANAVLQLLVYSPPLQNLFRQLGDLKRQRGGAPEPSGCATPLVDAMIRFFEEFMFEEKEPPPTHQPPQQTAEGTPKEGGVEKKYNKTVDSFEPTYLYEAMKEKRQLNHLLVCTYYPCALLMLIYAGLPCKGRQTRGCRRVFRPLPGRARWRVGRTTNLY